MLRLLALVIVLSTFMLQIIHKRGLSFFTNVKSLIGSHALFPAKLLLGGDFNSVLASEDRYTKKLDGSSTQLNNLVESMQLFDVWRSKNE